MVKKFLGYLLALIVLAFFWFSKPSLELEESPKLSSGDSIGSVLEVSGNVLTKTSTQAYFHPASKGSPLHSIQHFITGVEGKTLLEIDGGQFTLGPNSRIKIEDAEKSVRVRLLDGELRRLNKKGRAEFFIDNQLETDLTLNRKPTAPLASVPTLAEIHEVSKKPKTQVNSQINEEQILKNVRFSQKFFEKCFIAHYQRASGKTQGGRILVQYRVVKSGKIKEPSVKKSDYSDDNFHNCLEEVFRRIRIKNYSGPEATLEFPIDINLPDGQ